MADPSWWTTWGQNAVAVGGLVFGAVGTFLGFHNAAMARRTTRIAQEKRACEAEDRGRRAADRDRETQHRQWTEAVVLVLEEAGAVFSMPVEPEDMESALWARENGLLTFAPGFGGSKPEVRLPRGPVATRRA